MEVLNRLSKALTVGTSKQYKHCATKERKKTWAVAVLREVAVQQRPHGVGPFAVATQSGDAPRAHRARDRRSDFRQSQM